MAAGPTGHSRLVKIVAIDRNFPFHGSFRLKLRGELKGNEIDLLHQDKQVWIYPEARVQLGVDLGEELTLGETKFIVSDLIEEESGLSFQPTDLAPKLFISRAHLEETKLLGAGSLAYYTHLFRLADEADLKLFGKGWGNTIQFSGNPYLHPPASRTPCRSVTSIFVRFSFPCFAGLLFLACLGSGFLFMDSSTTE